MFFDVYSDLCARVGKRPSAVAEELGINKSNVTNWKNNGYTPRGDALQKIADYFGCTTDYLLGIEEQKKSPPANDREARRQELMQILDTMSDAEQEALLLGMRSRYVHEEK